jgi:surface protein
MSTSKLTINKLLSLLLVLSVVLTGLLPSTAVYASEVTNPGSGKSTAVLSSDGAIMSVGVPMSVLIYVDATGEVTTPDYLPIINNSPAPIYVRSLTIEPKNDWTLDPMNTDYKNFNPGQKHYWLSINGLDPSEPIAFATPISGSSSLNLDLSAGVAPQRSAINNFDIGVLRLSFGWTMQDGDQGDQEFGFEVVGASYVAPKTFAITFNTTEVGTFYVVAIPPEEVAPRSPFTASTMEVIEITNTGTQEHTVLFASADEGMTEADIYVWRATEKDAFDGPVKIEVRGEDTGSLPTGYVMATDADFSGTRDGEFRYIGSNPYVVVPHVIKGVSVTSYYYMFEGTDVKGVASDNPNITDMSYMFANSTSETLDLTYLDTSNVVNMSGMFSFTNAKSLDLSGFDTSNVTDMSKMFYGYSDTTLDLSGFDTSNVTDMSWMFAYSYYSPDFTNLDTSNVTNMAGMFEGNYSTTLDLTGLDTSSVTDMSNMFKGGRATTYDFSNFDTRNVTNMSNMFNENGATTLDLSNFDTSRLTNMSYMFRMGSVETLDISSFRLTEIQPSISGIFEYADNLTTVYVRSQEDIDYIIDRYYSEIPDTINFVIK